MARQDYGITVILIYLFFKFNNDEHSYYEDQN